MESERPETGVPETLTPTTPEKSKAGGMGVHIWDSITAIPLLCAIIICFAIIFIAFVAIIAVVITFAIGIILAIVVVILAGVVAIAGIIISGIASLVAPAILGAIAFCLNKLAGEKSMANVLITEAK